MSDNIKKSLKQRSKLTKIFLEKGNIIPAHKKEHKTLINNYRPISLLPIFGKIFERVIHSSLFNHFLSSKLSTPSQSGFLWRLMYCSTIINNS